MDVWNIFSIERRSAFLRFRLVDDDDFDDVLSGEKRSSMVDSEDFGEEDIKALKKKSKRTSSSSSSSSKPLRNNTSSSQQSTTEKERERDVGDTKREKIFMTFAFFVLVLFFWFIFQTTKVLLSLQKVFSV